MHCHRVPARSRDGSVEVLLVGPPNVGKSIIFNHITGLSVSAANYAGTTVEVARGEGRFGDLPVTLLDLPGIYTLSATNEAERAATEALARTKGLVIVVADALHLESSVYLLLQVLTCDRPTVVVLNRVDIARSKGREVSADVLSAELGVPVVPTIAIAGEGFRHLDAVISAVIRGGEAAVFAGRAQQDGPAEGRGTPDRAGDERTLWELAERIGELAVRETDAPARESGIRPAHANSRRRTLKPLPLARNTRRGLSLARFDSEALVRPWPGLAIAAGVLALTFAIIVGVGMGMRQLILLPLARDGLFPLLERIVVTYIDSGTFRNILIGDYGFLIKGIEWPFTLVLPYVLSFYLAMSLLEDSGYLPRLAVLLDGAMSRIGLRGSHTISLLLGYGCAIPGILSARAMGSRKERLIVATLLSLAIPCISQTGALIALLAEASVGLVVSVFALSIAVLIVAGLTLDRLVPGERSRLVYEIPELLVPHGGVLGMKMILRVRHYLLDGALPMIGAVGVAALLYETGTLAALGEFLSPLVTGWLRLPEAAAAPLLLGIVRRELSVLPLLDMELTHVQLFTGAVVGLFYVPCIAVVATIARELNLRTAAALLVMTTAVAFLLGGTVAQLGALLGS